VQPTKGAPVVGQDTVRVLLEAGFSEEEIRRYREAGVVK
jgi:crotonobetainyl-CoA:carnitine CoA-transferase CaiB-like acyl-CoA transferase